jgi:putative membrane protein
VKYVLWLLKAAIFFTLFAFALNNQQVVSVNFFFGTLWQAPLVLVVLAAFTLGLAAGVLVMVPRWWKNRSAAAAASKAASSAANNTPPPPPGPHHGL